MSGSIGQLACQDDSFWTRVLGAVSILLDTPDGTCLYGGDISTFNQKTIDRLALNEIADTQPDFMWCEATYGDGNHPAP